MNTISRVAQHSRHLRNPLVLTVLCLFLLGTDGCTLIGPLTLGCNDIPITVTPGTCTPFPVPECFGAFTGEGPVIEASGANAQFTVIGDENLGFQFCAAEGSPGTSEPERVPYLVTGGPGRFGRGEFLVTVEGLVDATVSDSPDPVNVGSELTYTITLTNRRQSSVSSVRFTNRLPGDVTFVSGLAGGCSLRAGEITCGDIMIAAGASATYQFVVRPTTPGTIVNELLLFDPFLSSPIAVTNTTTVNPANTPIVDATVSDSPDPVSVGSELTYTITLTNRRQSSVSLVEFINRLPGDVTFVSGLAGGCIMQNGEIRCSDITIAASGSVTYQFVVRPTTPGTITNELFLFDPVLASPVTVTNTTTVNPANNADVAVTVTDNPDPVTRGATVTYTIIVTNNGPAAATGVRLTDVVPPSEIFTVVVSQGTFTRTSPTQIICDFGTLASGASATMTVRGSAITTGTNINTATVTANEPDPNTANNTASESTTVNPP